MSLGEIFLFTLKVEAVCKAEHWEKYVYMIGDSSEDQRLTLYLYI